MNKSKNLSNCPLRVFLKTGFMIAGLTPVFCAHPLKDKGPFWYNGYVYGTRGFSLYAEGKLEDAINSYRKALAEARRLDIPRQAGLYTFNIGRCWLDLERYDSALAYFAGSYAEFKACRDSAAAERTAGFISLTFSELGNSDSAFAWYGRGAAGEAGKEGRALWLFIHGRLIWARDHGKEAVTYFEEAYAIYKKQKTYNAMAHMCRLRAGVYYSFGDYQESKKLIDEALFLSDKSRLRPNRFKILLAACSIYNRLNDREAARRFFERAKNCAPAGGVSIPTFEVFIASNKGL